MASVGTGLLTPHLSSHFHIPSSSRRSSKASRWLLSSKVHPQGQFYPNSYAEPPDTTKYARHTLGPWRPAIPCGRDLGRSQHRAPSLPDGGRRRLSGSRSGPTPFVLSRVASLQLPKRLIAVCPPTEPTSAHPASISQPGVTFFIHASQLPGSPDPRVPTGAGRTGRVRQCRLHEAAPPGGC